MRLRLALVAVVLLNTSAAVATDAPTVFRALDSPAGARSSAPMLSVSPDGRVVLSWVESRDSLAQLRYAVLDGERWGGATLVAQGVGWFVNWADVPAVVALDDAHMAAYWLQKSGPDTYAYDIRVQTSGDRGKTWSAPLTPHRDGTQTEHGFVSVARVNGRLLMVWLDGRKYAAVENEDDGETTLRAAFIDDAGKLSGEVEIDGRVCDCCPTTMVTVPGGAFVAYRDRSDSDVRDISVASLGAGGWTSPRTPIADGWQIAGCPVNGPAAATAGARMVLAWFTAADTGPRVRAAFSEDGGASFAPPLDIGGDSPLGRVDVTFLADGDAVVCWMQVAGDDAEVLVRRVATTGGAGAPVRIATTSGGRGSGYPRIAVLGDRVIAAWTQPGEPSQVRTAAAPAAMIPRP